MRRRELQPLVARHFAPSFPGLRQARDLLVTVDDGIARGFLFGRSQMDGRTVRLHVMAQALFVPTDAVELVFARELGNHHFDEPERADEVMAAMRRRAEEEGPPFLELAVDCASLAAHARELANELVDRAAVTEARAYCLVRANDAGRAREELEGLARELAASGVGYHAQVLERVRTVADALERSPREACDVLDAWERETAQALGLGAA